MDAPQSITCTSCGAPLTPVSDKDYFVCTYCGAYYFPKGNIDGVKLIGEPGKGTCPVCKLPLVTGCIDDVAVETCPKCHGLLFNQPQMSFIIRVLRQFSKKSEVVAPLPRADLDVVRYCQTCGHRMDTHPYGAGGNVVIDNCATCGLVWLDYGELKKILSAPDYESNQDGDLGL